MTSLSSSDEYLIKMSLPYDAKTQIRLSIDGAECCACGFIFSGSGSPSKYQIIQHYYNCHQVKLIIKENTGTEKEPRRHKMFSSIKDAEEFTRTILTYHLELNLDLSAWDLDSTKELFTPYSHAYGVNLSSHKMEYYLEHRYNRIVEIMKELLKNKIFSIRVDIVSQGGPYLLVITAHFFHNWMFRILALGSVVIPDKEFLNSTGTVQYLILECLRKYNVQETQVYTYSFGYSDDLLNVSKPALDEEEDHSDRPKYMHCQDLLHKDIPGRNINEAVLQVLKPLDQLEQIRSLLHNLQKTSADSLDLKIPPVDDKDRWLTTLNMLRRLLAIKKRLSEEQTKDVDWTFVGKLVDVMEAIEKLFQVFSRENYYITDFARDLWLCEIRLNEMVKNQNEYATTMLTSLADFTKDLQNSPMYLAALFVDPRFNIVNAPKLSTSDKQIAIDFINKLYSQMIKVENDSIKEEPLTRAEEPSVSKKRRVTSEDLLRSAMYVQGYQKREGCKISQELRTLCRDYALDSDTNVAFYWSIEAVRKPLIAKMASIVLSPPISQFTTERIFECLPMVDKYITSNECPEDLERRILVKLNKNLD